MSGPPSTISTPGRSGPGFSAVRLGARHAVQPQAAAVEPPAVRAGYEPRDDERGGGDCQVGTDEIIFAAWVRQRLGTGHVIHAGAYSTCQVPGYAGRCVRVVFPLPNGNAIVVMQPVAHEDGSLSLISAGRGFGHPGFYSVHGPGGVIWARYLRALRETIRVYASADGEVRADHVLKLWGLSLLRLHYRLRRKTAAPVLAPVVASAWQ